MTENLTKLIESALNDSEFPCARCQHCDRQVNAVMSVVEDVAEAIRQARRIMATSSRDWSLTAGDVWLWALIVGWDCEIPEHADGDHDPIDCDGPNRLEDFAERFGWTDGGIAKLRAQRRAIAALDATPKAPS